MQYHFFNEAVFYLDFMSNCFDLMEIHFDFIISDVDFQNSTWIFFVFKHSLLELKKIIILRR